MDEDPQIAQDDENEDHECVTESDDDEIDALL